THLQVFPRWENAAAPRPERSSHRRKLPRIGRRPRRETRRDRSGRAPRTENAPGTQVPRYKTGSFRRNPSPGSRRDEIRARCRGSSRADVPDELLRRAGAPLRAKSFLGGDEIATVMNIQAVRVGPMFVDAAPGISPIVIDLT